MPQGSRPRAIGVRLCLLLGATLLGAMLAAPVAADDESGRLAGPTVLPHRGTTETPFTFLVEYQDRRGDPAVVKVEVAGSWHTMTADGSAWRSGVHFNFTSTLPAGRHAVTFGAWTGDEVEFLSGADVVVSRADAPAPTPTAPPTPPPTPAPTPTQRPTPTPTPSPPPSRAPSPSPTATPAARATPTATPAARATPTATPAARATPTAIASGPSESSPPPVEASTAIAEPTATPAAPAAAGSSPAPSAAHGAATSSPDSPTRAPAASGEPAAGPVAPGSPSPPDDVPSALSGWGAPTGILRRLGLEPSLSLELRVGQAFVVSGGGMTLLMGFMFLGKRRRDGEPTAPDEVLEASAARASTEPADASLATPPVPVDPDLLMPRWRRPSLLEARNADPRRQAAPVVPMSFGDADGASTDGAERRLIRYFIVDLLDAPDELRSTPVGTLARGDEVQLLERSGTYWRVLCPNGQEGWLHRMTLGAEVGAAATATGGDAVSADREAAAPESDLFASFVAARRQAEPRP